MAAPAPLSIEDRQAEWDRTPLFMRDLPAGDAAEDNIALQALQSLVYEDGPEGTAAALRQQANDCFRARRFRDALGFYRQALDQLGAELDVATRRALHANRAACHLELGNFRSCLRDCAAVLAESPSSSSTADALAQKALYRSARALIAVDRLDEADDALRRLRAAGSDAAALEADVARRRRATDAKAAALAEQSHARAADELRIAVALRKLGLALPAPWSYAAAALACPIDVRPPHFDAEAPELLALPVFVLRPTAEPPTRDLVLEWLEDVPVALQLDALGLDGEHEAYATTRARRVLKLGRKLTLARAIAAARSPDGADGLELRDGWCLELYAVPRARATAWLAELKASLRA